MVRYKHIALHVLLLRSPPQREYFFLVVVKHSNSTPDYYCSIILLRAPFNGNKPGAAGNAFLISPTVLASTHPQRRLHINSVGHIDSARTRCARDTPTPLQRHPQRSENEGKVLCNKLPRCRLWPWCWLVTHH